MSPFLSHTNAQDDLRITDTGYAGYTLGQRTRGASQVAKRARSRLYNRLYFFQTDGLSSTVETLRGKVRVCFITPVVVRLWQYNLHLR